MFNALSPEECRIILNVSRETINKFELYLNLLQKWQKNLNLVGNSTLKDPWRRHILDCAQIYKYLENKENVTNIIHAFNQAIK